MLVPLFTSPPLRTRLALVMIFVMPVLHHTRNQPDILTIQEAILRFNSSLGSFGVRNFVKGLRSFVKYAH